MVYCINCFISIFNLMSPITAIKIAFILLIPPFDSHDTWTVNLVPNQVQVQHLKQCLSVSYEAEPLPCDREYELGTNQRLLDPEHDQVPVCYLVKDITRPQFVKSCAYHGVVQNEN